MEIWFKRILAVLLIGLFIFLAAMVAYTSWTIFQRTLGLLTSAGNLSTEQALPLYMQVYGGVVREALISLLNTLVVAFVAYVTGKTVSIVSYNATKARSPDSEPQLLKLFD